MTCEQFEELSGAYVLDALTPDEQLKAEEHLATCPRCTQLVQELRSVVTLLPLAVPQLQPSEALQERIMAGIRQEDASSTAPDRARQSPTQIPTPILSAPSSVRSTPQRTRSPWTPRVLIAAAILMFVLLGGMIALASWNISLTHQVASLQNQLAHATPSKPTQEAASYAVNGTKYAQGASGQLIYYSAQNITVLTLHNLPQLTGQHVYQGWLMQLQGQTVTNVISIGLLNVQNASATVAFAGNITGYNATGVSLEPGPIATPKAPRGNVVALGTFTHSS